MNEMTLPARRTAPHASGPGDLPTADERQRIDRDGFLVLPGFFGADEVADILRWTDELFSTPEQAGRHMVYYEDSLTEPGRRVVQRIENFCPFHNGFDALVRDGRLSAWAGALMGGAAVLFKEKINFKLPGADGFKLHQDQAAGWTRFAPIFLTALVTIDPATIANGCLELAAGRHREGMLGAEWSPLDEGSVALEPVETAPGDVVFFDSFAPHASKPNLTDSPRRLLYLTYNLADDGDHRETYFTEKRAAFPPDIEREEGARYTFRV